MKPATEQQALQWLGENLRFQRTIRRLSQEAVAFRAEVHRTQFSLLEHGQRQPLALTFVKLCGGLGMSADELLGGVHWQPAVSGTGCFLIPEREVWEQ